MKIGIIYIQLNMLLKPIIYIFTCVLFLPIAISTE